MDEPLAEYLDRMIRDNYARTEEKFSGLARYHIEPKSSYDVEEYIEDPQTGRPVPIEDSADHYLLLSFDRVRREIFDLPMVGSERGYVRRFDGTYDSVAHTQPHAVVSGEIPWRSFSTLPSDEDSDLYRRDEYGWWRCVECAHLPSDHFGPGSFECALCNCGNNAR